MCVYTYYIYIMESVYIALTLPSQIHNYNSGHHFSLCTPTHDAMQDMSYIHKFMNSVRYFTMQGVTTMTYDEKQRP